MTLEAFRKERGMTQRELADRLEVDQAAISHWENKKYTPQRKYRKKIAKLMGVSLEAVDAMFHKEE